MLAPIINIILSIGANFMIIIILIYINNRIARGEVNCEARGEERAVKRSLTKRLLSYKPMTAVS